MSGLTDVKTISEEEAISKGLLQYIGEDVDKVYIEKVKSLVLRKELIEEKAKDLNIIYTPIHGSGLMPIKRALTELGFENLNIVKLPKSNVLKYILEDDSWFVVRPSGTEPKMKIYLSVVGESLKDSEEKIGNFKNSVMDKINSILG